MTKPNDIPYDVWDKATEVGLLGYLPEHVVESIARAIMAAKEEAEAERDMLQDILDGRPDINAGLPDSYIRWSQSIYSGDFVRAAIRNRKLANNTNKD